MPVPNIIKMKKLFCLLTFIWLLSSCESSTVDLDAKIKFDGSQFTITNTTQEDWVNAELEVNTDYIYVAKRIKAGETYTIGMMQFANSDGVRLLPTIKPSVFTVYCDLKGEKKGYLYATIN